MDSRRAANSVTKQTLLQVASLFKPESDAGGLTIHLPSVQQQKGCHDCGLFALAFMVEVCEGRAPGSATFDQPGMRSHLQRCMKNGKLSAFPKVQRIKGIAFSRKKRIQKKLYCICRMPAIYDDQMISCDGCGEWYHCKCVPTAIAKKTWFCSACI